MGTSRSAPVVTGTIALWLEIDPNLTPSKVRDVIKKNSTPSYQTETYNPDNTFGWGRIDAYQGAVEVVQIKNNIINVNDKLITYTITKDKIEIKSDSEIDNITITDIQGRQVYNMKTNQKNSFNGSYNYNMNITGISQGVYIMRMKGKNIINE